MMRGWRVSKSTETNDSHQGPRDLKQKNKAREYTHKFCFKQRIRSRLRVIDDQRCKPKEARIDTTG